MNLIEEIAELTEPTDAQKAAVRDRMQPFLTNYTRTDGVNYALIGVLFLLLLAVQVCSRQYVLLSTAAFVPLAAVFFGFAYRDCIKVKKGRKWLQELADGAFLVAPVTAFDFIYQPNESNTGYLYKAHVRTSGGRYLQNTYTADVCYALSEIQKSGSRDIERDMLLVSTADGGYRLLLKAE